MRCGADIADPVVVWSHVDIHASAGTIKDIHGQDATGHDLQLIVLPYDEKSKKTATKYTVTFGNSHASIIGAPPDRQFGTRNNTNYRKSRLRNSLFCQQVRSGPPSTSTITPCSSVIKTVHCSLYETGRHPAIPTLTVARRFLREEMR